MYPVGWAAVEIYSERSENGRPLHDLEPDQFSDGLRRLLDRGLWRSGHVQHHTASVAAAIGSDTQAVSRLTSRFHVSADLRVRHSV